jgi:type III pantothenate kinase
MSLPFLLINANNTNTSFALANEKRIVRTARVRTAAIREIPFPARCYEAAVLASVVPAATKKLVRLLRAPPLLVDAFLDLGIDIAYPRKKQIGADRLANAVGVAKLYGAPAIVVDFGTALTFDIVKRSTRSENSRSQPGLEARAQYVGGVIAPGLAAVTEYLHQRTALLPRIRIAEPRRGGVIGRSTVEAMRVGVVIGYRGLVKEILGALKREPGLRPAIVVATGGYGALMARGIPDIQHVNPLLTLEGLRFIYLRNRDR